MADRDDEALEYWNNRWKNNQTGWHQPTINEALIKFLPEITGIALPEAGATGTLKNEQFLVPLCGKTKDIPFLHKLGYRIFGIEGAFKAIKDLEEENQFDFEFDEENSIYQSKDGRIKIYHGNFFKCPMEKWGPFHYVWDRGSLIAMDYQDHEAYVAVMKRVLAGGNFKYLLESVEYDKTKFGGPPRSLNESEISALYGHWADVKMLERKPLPKEHALFTKWNLDKVDRFAYLIMPKSSG